MFATVLYLFPRAVCCSRQNMNKEYIDFRRQEPSMHSKLYSISLGLHLPTIATAGAVTMGNRKGRAIQLILLRVTARTRYELQLLNVTRILPPPCYSDLCPMTATREVLDLQETNVERIKRVDYSANFCSVQVTESNGIRMHAGCVQLIQPRIPPHRVEKRFFVWVIIYHCPHCLRRAQSTTGNPLFILTSKCTRSH